MCEGYLGLVFMGTKLNPSVELCFFYLPMSGAIIIYVQQCGSEFSVVLDGQVEDW
jgi:hypothetical protein